MAKALSVTQINTNLRLENQLLRDQLAAAATSKAFVVREYHAKVAGLQAELRATRQQAMPAVSDRRAAMDAAKAAAIASGKTVSV